MNFAGAFFMIGTPIAILIHGILFYKAITKVEKEEEELEWWQK